jgi:hypothetical protein
MVVIAGLFLFTSLGCEVRTSARLGIGPSFSLNGSGRLASFTVYGPRPGHKIATPNDAKSELWSIQPSGGYGSVPVAHMSLVYGNPPEGYAQTVPGQGHAPALTAGFVYYFFIETTGAPGKDGFFYMDKTAPILIRVPDLCESGFNGDVQPLRCGTKEPYSEPNDLDEFVRQNRVSE